MKRSLIFFERWLDPVAEDVLVQQPDIELVRLSYADSEAGNWAKMEQAHGYQISPGTEIRPPWRADAALLARCPNLLAISSSGAGFDTIDVAECTRLGILVCNQSGSNHHSVAEHTLGFMLALSKKIVLYGHLMRKQSLDNRFDHLGREVRGKTVGLVGIGKIGTRVAEMCRGILDMQVLACDPYLSASEIEQRGGTKVDLDGLFARSDFVSVHCPLNAETRGMIGASQLGRMKPSAFFITTARGGVHDEAALVEALAARRIAGAGIDVFDVEPPPHTHPLLRFDTVIATPHIAGVTVESMRSMAQNAAEQWVTLLSAGRPPRIVNPEVWPRYCERHARILGQQPASDRED